MQNHIIKFKLLNAETNMRMNVVEYYGRTIIIEDGESNMKDLIRITKPDQCINDINRVLDDYSKQGYLIEEYTAL